MPLHQPSCCFMYLQRFNYLFVRVSCGASDDSHKFSRWIPKELLLFLCERCSSREWWCHGVLRKCFDECDVIKALDAKMPRQEHFIHQINPDCFSLWKTLNLYLNLYVTRVIPAARNSFISHSYLSSFIGLIGCSMSQGGHLNKVEID